MGGGRGRGGEREAEMGREGGSLGGEGRDGGREGGRGGGGDGGIDGGRKGGPDGGAGREVGQIRMSFSGLRSRPPLAAGLTSAMNVSTGIGSPLLCVAFSMSMDPELGAIRAVHNIASCRGEEDGVVVVRVDVGVGFGHAVRPNRL